MSLKNTQKISTSKPKKAKKVKNSASAQEAIARLDEFNKALGI